jgi:serine/threonine protein kinase
MDYNTPVMPSSSPLVANRFRSLFVIGRGGMGWVEVALEQGERGFQRIVALKRMLPEASIDRHQIDMFMREAHVAELLSHPNVVHAFAFGEDKGELFLAMEYVEGEPLSRMLTVAHKQEGRIAAPLVAHFLAEVCEGLHAAHELCDPTGKPLNLIHRDVSPHNVMVAYDGYVKLLDFGVVKIDQLDPKGGRTKTGEVKGKTAYMSPEQAMGESLDRRSDLYSLGAVLFECIAGQRMWGMGTDFDVLRRLALEEPPRLADVAPSAPRALCALQARLVARNREERPPTALAVAAELRRFIADSGTQPDAHVVRAVMGRLFHQEIERRRDALGRALHEAAPAEAEDLRKSMSLVTGFSDTRIEIPLPVAEARPVVVRARGLVSVPPSAGEFEADTSVDADPSQAWRAEPQDEISLPMQRSRVLPWAVGAAALLVMGSVGFLRFRPRTSDSPGDTSASVAMASSASSPRPVSTSSASSASSASGLSASVSHPDPPQVARKTSEPATSREAPPVEARAPRVGTKATGQGPPPAGPVPSPPKPARSAAPTGPSPLPLDEHPI